jgi:hypothetical protein
MYTRPQPRVAPFLGVTITILLLLFYGVLAIATRDPLWFWPRFDARPERMVITYHGRELTVEPSHPRYERLVQVLNRTLSGVDRWEDLGLSTASLAEYRAGQGVIIEAFYPRPQRIHSRFAFGTFRHLLLPLEGTHAHRRVVFAGSEGTFRSGALALKDTTALHAIVAEVAGQ